MFFKGELSDLCDIIYVPRGTTEPVHIAVLRVPEGKANDSFCLYGRAMRHAEVFQCAVGGMGLYLLARFQITGEAETFDFTDNRSWYDIPLLVSSKNPRKNVGDRPYYEAIKQTCSKLQIPTAHFIHFGHSIGAKCGELEELNQKTIEALGNWNVGTFQGHYSSHIPMKGLRVAAGHDENKHSLWYARTQVKPSDGLVTSLWPWIEAGFEEIRPFGTEKKTAIAFLRFMDRLRTVILQDACEMMLRGRDHWVFEHEIFKHPDFLRMKEEMKAHIDMENPAVNRNIEMVLPGLCDKMNNFHMTMESNFRMVHNDTNTIKRQMITTTQMRAITQGVASIARDVLQSPAWKKRVTLQDVVAECDYGKSDDDEVQVVQQEPPQELPQVPAQPRVLTLAASSNIPTKWLKLRPCSNHTSCRSVYNEWNGLGVFNPDVNPNRPIGGLSELEYK